MREISAHQRLLHVIPLATALAPEDRVRLSAAFPEFDVDALLDEAGVMGDGNGATDSEDKAARVRSLRFELSLAELALARTLPKSEEVWMATGRRLAETSQYEFYAGILGLVGGGGAAGGAALSSYVPTVILGAVAFIASCFTLYAQHQRRSLREGTGLATIYVELAEQRGKLLQLQDSIKLWSTADDDLVLASDDRLHAVVRQVRVLTARFEELTGQVAPLLAVNVK